MPKPIKKKEKKTEKPLPLAKLAPLSLAESVEKVLITGDLTPLTPAERVDYYRKVCMSLGLNPLTSPFQYILFQETTGGPAKLSLYATKSCTEQLRKIHGVSVIPPFRRSKSDGIITVEVDVRDRTGRTDTASGSVPTWKWKDSRRVELDGKELCNADMKCETKAKRRATLSICGLAFLDESELDTMTVVGGVTPDGRIYQYRDAPQAEQPALNENAEHGHAPGSPEALMAEAALRRSEEEDRKLAESQKKAPEASIHPDLTRTSDIPTATTVKPLADLPADAKQVVVDWHDKDNPIVTGDGDALEGLKPLLTWGADSFWHVKAADVQKIGEVCAVSSYRFQEILPETSSGRSANAPKAAAREGGTRPPKTASAPAAESEIEKCSVQAVSEKMTQGVKADPGRNIKGRASQPYLSVLIKTERGDKWTACFDRDLFPYIVKGKGKECEFYVRTTPKGVNIVGLKRVGPLEFEEGKLPVVQKNREPGTAPRLFP